MSAIFISYSSKDREFALEMADRLEQFFDVWIDREGLEGGMAWEQAIESALKDCQIFIVIVSPDSNLSDWVARETILAEQLKKHRIPILLVGELPFRLLNLHYIDFRGDFEGGFLDLLDSLKKHLQPQDKTHDSVNQLIGEAIRARLAGDISSANTFIGQALAIEAGLAPAIDAFWSRLTQESHSDYAAQLRKQMAAGKQFIVEQTRLLDSTLYGDDDTYEWSLFVDADDTLLDQIEYVQYQLHPTFTEPTRIVRNRSAKFRLTMIGWGTFEVGVKIQFKDGSELKVIHDLQFDVD